MIDLSYEQQQASANLRKCYENLKQGNVVSLLMPEQEMIDSWEHFPKGDVKDFENHTQYFYHAHPSNDQDRVVEHGHFHVFVRKNAIHSNCIAVITSEEYEKSQGERDNLTHLFAIAMNQVGMPTAFFTVNHWVVLGAWYEAEVLIPLLDSFKVEAVDPTYQLTSFWLTNMVHLFKPMLAELLTKRDSIIQDALKKNSLHEVFYDKNLEITSVLSLCEQ